MLGFTCNVLIGFSIELGTSIAVLLASFVGMPISTTHCAVGSVIAVGLLNPVGHRSVDWSLVSKVASSWLLTVPLAGVIAAILFAMLRSTVSGVDAAAVAAAANGTVSLCMNCTSVLVN